jgi:hypothetical protein
LVAVADELGLPEGAGPYPRLPLAVSVARRRWQAGRRQVLRQALRAGLGGALAWALFGLTTPLYEALRSPESFRTAIQELLSVPAWMLAAALVAGVVGGILGWVLGLGAGMADALWKGRASSGWRQAAGSLAGLAITIHLVVFTLMHAYQPSAAPGIYIPVYVLYGLLLGLIVTFAIPGLGESAPFRRQFVRSVGAGAIGAAVTIPYVFLVYRTEVGISLLPRLLNAFLLVFGIGMALSSRNRAAQSLAVVEGDQGLR